MSGCLACLRLCPRTRLRAHRDGRVRKTGSLPAYTRAATRNALIDWMRRHRNELDAVDQETLDRGLGSDEAVPDPVVQIQLRKALDSLSERHREVVEHIYLQGRTYEETARALERPAPDTEAPRGSPWPPCSSPWSCAPSP